MRYKKLIVVLTALLFIFVFYGCTKDNSKTTGVDDDDAIYKEIILNDLLKAEHISSIDLNQDNDLVLYIGGDSRKYIILDGHTEVKKEIKVDYGGRVDIFSTGRGNDIYILSETPEMNENKDITGIRLKLYHHDNEGDSIKESNIIGELNNTTAKSTDEITKKIKVDSKGNIYALKLGGRIEVFDNNFNSKKILDSTLYWDIEIDEEDNIFAVHKEIGKNIMDKIDTNNYKTIWSKEYSYEDRPERIYYNKNTKNLYGINAGWVAKYDSKGNMTNRLLSTGELSDIDHILNFVVDNDEEVYLIADADQSYKLIKYTKSDSEMEISTVDEVDKTEITVELTVDFGNQFTKAARRFQEENPDVKVTVNLYPDLEPYQYTDKLNTELMAGKGPDVLYLRGGEIRAYIEKDILVKLDEMIEKDKEFNFKDYDRRIIDNARYKDELYVMTMGYNSFDSFVINEKLLEEKRITVDEDLIWKDIYNLSKKLNENSKEQIYVLPEIHDYMLFEGIILQDIDYYLDWDKKESKIHSKEFIEALELLKSIIEEDIMHPDLDWGDVLDAINAGGTRDVSNIAMIPGQTSAYHYIRPMGDVFNSFNAISAPKGEYTGDRLYYSDFLAINSNSKHQEEAWEFIKFMLTEEVQAMDPYILQSRFHINKGASKKQIDRTIFEQQEKYEKQMKKDNKYFATEEDIERLNKIIGNLNKPYMAENFHGIMYEEIQTFLNGEKTAEDLAKQLHNKAMIYLYE